MTTQVVLSALIAGMLLGPAAWLADRAATLCGRPRRWVWAAALVVALALPLTAPWRAAADIAPTATASEVVVTTASVASAAMGTSLAARIQGAADAIGTALASVDSWVMWCWVLLSAAAAGLFIGSTLSLQRQRRAWARAAVGGADVLVTDRTGPAVIGLLRPAIALPAWTLALDQEAQALIVTHEREHVAARDPWLVHAAAVAIVTMPWNPMVWWLAARLRLAVEFDCDARVLASRAGVEHAASRYSQVLLVVATRHEPRGVVVVPALIESWSSLSQRIAAMCASPARFGRTQMIVAGIGAAALLVAACRAPVPAPQTDSAGDPAGGVSEVRPEGVVDLPAPAPVSSEPPASIASPGATSAPAPTVRREISFERPPADAPGARGPVPAFTWPIVVRGPNPTYTPDAMRRKIQGVVTVEVVVGADGKVGDVKLVKGLDPGLDQSAMDVARRWEFEPATEGGKPVQKQVEIELAFRLH